MFKMQHFGNKFSKIAKHYGSLRPQRPLAFYNSDLNLCNLT